jgi:hypothetical protein
MLLSNAQYTKLGERVRKQLYVNITINYKCTSVEPSLDKKEN